MSKQWSLKYNDDVCMGNVRKSALLLASCQHLLETHEGNKTLLLPAIPISKHQGFGCFTAYRFNKASLINPGLVGFVPPNSPGGLRFFDLKKTQKATLGPRKASSTCFSVPVFGNTCLFFS